MNLIKLEALVSQEALDSCLILLWDSSAVSIQGLNSWSSALVVCIVHKLISTDKHKISFLLICEQEVFITEQSIVKLFPS